MRSSLSCHATGGGRRLPGVTTYSAQCSILELCGTNLRYLMFLSVILPDVTFLLLFVHFAVLKLSVKSSQV